MIEQATPQTTEEEGKNAQSKSFLPKWLANTLKAIIFSLVIFFVYRSISNKEKFSEEFMASMEQLFVWENAPFILLVCLLIFVNWALEAWKWKLLVRKMQPITFFEAFKGVLTGITMSFISTNYTGHYFGRVWQLDHKDRYQMLGAMFLNGVSQAYITYYAGFLGLIYFLNWNGMLPDAYYPWLMGWILFAGGGFGYLLYRSIGYVESLKKIKWLYTYLKIMTSYPFRETLALAVISAFRYGVYCSQFILLLWLFEGAIALPISQLLSGIALVYLAKALIPNLSFLTDLGIREFTALQFLGAEGYGMADGVIIASTITLWLLNILIPVAAGAGFTLKMKIRDRG